MKNLITTSISGAIKAPFTAPALNNLQQNFNEIPASIIKALLGTYTANDVIILEGFVNTLSNSNNTSTWTAGSVYYNGEVYQVAAGTLTKAGGQTFLYSIVDTITNDTFSDGTSQPWIEVRTITITAGTSGTGIADYGAATVKIYPEEIWRYVGAGGQPAFQNTWAAGSGSRPIAFKKSLNGKIHLRGSATQTLGAGSIIFTLPTGYFDTVNDIYFSAMATGSGGVLVPIAINIDHTTGNVSAGDFASAVSISQIYIGEISFDLK